MKGKAGLRRERKTILNPSRPIARSRERNFGFPLAQPATFCLRKGSRQPKGTQGPKIGSHQDDEKTGLESEQSARADGDRAARNHKNGREDVGQRDGRRTDCSKASHVSFQLREPFLDREKEKTNPHPKQNGRQKNRLTARHFLHPSALQPL